MPAEYDIKLQDLAKIALGSPEFSNIQIGILQSLIEILLKKLNCENETVSLNAYESKHLENILKTAKISPIVVNDKKVERISEKLERLNKLEGRINRMDTLLEHHLEETARKNNFKETIIDWTNWPTDDVEHLCTTCDPDSTTACTLLKNTDFIKKLLRRMAAPMIERLFYFEEKVEKLNETFTNFMERVNEEFLKIQLLERCIVEIEKLTQHADEQKELFINTMEEVQEIMDTKLDKMHIPELKKFIADNFKNIEDIIKVLKTKKTYPRAAGIIMEGVHCACCGNSKICSDIGVETASMLPSVVPKPVKLYKSCGTACEFRSHKRFKASWNISDNINIVDRKVKTSPTFQSNLPKCRKPGEDFELLEGFDGQLYRKG